MSEYEEAANDFLQSIGATFTAEFKRSGPMFDDDKEPRDIYAIKLTRDGRPAFETEFGQCLAKSVVWAARHCNCGVRHRETVIHARKCPAKRATPGMRQQGLLAPSAYDLLAGLTKSDPGTFKDFCGDFGYDTDSRKALDLYLRVQTEWSKVRSFFTAAELERLQKIN